MRIVTFQSKHVIKDMLRSDIYINLTVKDVGQEKKIVM